MNVLLTHAAIGRGGDAVQWRSIAEGFALVGHRVRSIGGIAATPYDMNRIAARSRSLASGLPWWARDLVETGLQPVALFVAWRVIRSMRIDLVVHRAAPYDMMTPVLARALRGPLIIYLDTHLPSERQHRHESYWRGLHERSMQWAGRLAALCVVPSRPIREYYEQVGIPADKLLVRANGVFERHLKLGREAARVSPPMRNPGSCTLGFVGSLSAWHRVDLLLEALAMLARRSQSVAYRVVIVGTGRQEPALRAQAERLGVGHLVDWKGPMDHESAVGAMAQFDIAVLPSTLPTGTPMKLAEYAAMGRPIIAPALANIRDQFVPGVEAVLVEPGDARALADAVARLAASPEETRRVAQAGQAKAGANTWEETARLLVSLAVGRVHVTA